MRPRNLVLAGSAPSLFEFAAIQGWLPYKHWEFAIDRKLSLAADEADASEYLRLFID
jgi:hypothetical protein